VAGAAAALGMNVQAFDPYLDNFGEAGRVENLEKLLKGSDVVSVHVPLTDDTRLMFGPTQFKAMKPGAIFINTARGGLVDHEALLVALDSGHLFGAGLDVTDPEPLPAGHPLLGRDDVVITPHVASGTREGKMRLFNLAFEQVLQVISGARPANLVNPEVWQ
jgi:phosphoglycerate dehydrogenase-like enzyme